MDSIILRVSSQFLAPIIIYLSILFVFRGHHYPGGGFIGGLFAASAFALLILNDQSSKTFANVWAMQGLVIGLLCLFISILIGPFYDLPMLSAIWGEIIIIDQSTIKLGSPLLFDFGIYFIVTSGLILTIQTLEKV